MGAPWALLFHHHQGSGNKNLAIIQRVYIYIKPQQLIMVRFFLSLPRPDGISARDSWETRGMRRSRLCVFFLSSPQIFFCARKGGNLASSFFCASVRTTRARFSRRFAFCGYSFARNASSFVRERRSDGWFPRVYESTKGRGRGSRSAVFLFFFFFSSFTSHSHENFSFSKNTAIAKDV